MKTETQHDSDEDRNEMPDCTHPLADKLFLVAAVCVIIFAVYMAQRYPINIAEIIRLPQGVDHPPPIADVLIWIAGIVVMIFAAIVFVMAIVGTVIGARVKADAELSKKTKPREIVVDGVRYREVE